MSDPSIESQSSWKTSSLERENHRTLLGRGAVLSAIDAWLSTGGDRGYLLVSGNPGAGKSALLSACVERYAATLGPVPHHFLRRGVMDWDRAYAAQSSLVAQISARFPSAGNPDARPERRLLELLLRISNKHLIPEQRRLLLIIDGLNEASTDGEDEPLERFMPTALPPGVFVLCSLRSGHPFLSFFAERPHRLINLDRLERQHGGRHAAVRAMWTAAVSELGLSEDFIENAVRAGDGNALHARLLIESLAALPPAERQARTVEPLPFGLWAMLEDLFEALSEGDAAPVDRAVLAILAAVREPLSLAVLSEIWGAPLDEHFLSVVRPFLGVHIIGGEARYRLAHDTFRELVLTRLGAADVRRVHRQLSQTLAMWPTGEFDDGSSTPQGLERRRYALEHAVHHRIEAGDFAGVESVLTDLSFLIAKVEEVGTLALEDDYAQAAARAPEPVRKKEWRDLQRAVREETHWLRKEPRSLPSLLYNRLRVMGWPGARIGRVLPLMQGLPHLRLQRTIGSYERTLLGHASSIYGCSPSSDGKLLVSASWDRTLKVWDLSSGHQLLSLKGHTAEVTGCALLPGEKQILSSSADFTLNVWELATGAVLKTLRGHSAEVTSCAVFADGERVLSGARDKTLRIWNVHSGEVIRSLIGHQAWVTSCAVHPDGERVLSGSWDKTLRLWNAETGETILSLSGHAAGVRAVGMLPDGRRAVSGSEDHTLRLWDLSSGSVLQEFHGHTASVTGCAVLPDGRRMVSTSKDRSLRLWDLSTGETLATLQGHSAWVTACAVLPDGRHVVSGSDDYSIKIWDLLAGRELQAVQGHTAAVSACVFVPGQQRLLTGSADRTLQLWDTATGAALKTLQGHTDLVTACAVTPDGKRVVSGSWDRTLRVFELGTSTLLRTMHGHGWFVTACAVTPDGKRVVSGSWDKTARVWEIDSGRELAVMRGHGAPVTCVAPLPDADCVLTGGRDSSLRLWDLLTGSEVQVLRGHLDCVRTCAAAPGLRAISGGEDRTLKVWDLSTGEERQTLTGHAAAVTGCVMADGGLIAVSCSEDHTVRVWDLQTGQCLDTFYGDAPFDCVAIEGERICAGDRNGNIWMLSASLRE